MEEGQDEMYDVFTNWIAGVPAGTVVTWTGPAGPERFELTDGLLPDGTYAADRTALYRHR
ncbi:hypothetical protein ACFWBN_24650 [Streptomyces sp. NPDC059989]|uniref:hypothetical protein n=1 Tax=Streptomyces sp. NPDC059989 TaxID=3347026 RepID=UPI003685C9BF